MVVSNLRAHCEMKWLPIWHFLEVTLLNFGNGIKFLSIMSAHKFLSSLNALRYMKECKKQKIGFAREPWKTKWPSWFSLAPTFILQPLFTHTIYPRNFFCLLFYNAFHAIYHNRQISWDILGPYLGHWKVIAAYIEI